MKGSFVFDEFELNADRFELRRAGKLVELQPKMLRLLCYLVAHHDRAVAANELMEQLWPGVHVELGSLRRAVLGVRHALHGNHHGQDYVQTVRGLGYRFVPGPHFTCSAVGSASVQPGTMAPRSAQHEPAPEVSQVHLDRLVVRPQVAALLGAVANRRTRGLLLHGPAGVGKTHTLGQIVSALQSAGVNCWSARCSSEVGTPALWPFIQALRMAAQAMGAERLRRLQGLNGPDFVEALREQCLPCPDRACSVLVTAKTARFQVFDAVAQLVRNTAAEAPLAFIFDDLQYADAVSLQLMGFLLQQVSGAPLLIVGACRDGVQGSGGAMEALLALSSVDSVAHLSVPPLTEAEIASYIEQVVGCAAPDSAVQCVLAQTAGNPLFVQQVLACWAAMDEGKEPCWDRLGSMRTPSLSVAIQRHLDIISKPCRDLLQAAAVLGRQFCATRLAALVSEEPGTIWSLLAEAQRTRLVESKKGRPGYYHFTHGLICEVLYEQLDAVSRARLHGSAAKALRAQGIGHDAGSLATVVRHLVAAAPMFDDGLALEYVLKAAEGARGRFAYDDVVGYLEMALRLTEQLPPAPARRIELLIRCGEAMARTTGRSGERRLFLEALHLAQEVDDEQGMLEAAIRLAERPGPCQRDDVQIATLEGVLSRLQARPERALVIKACLAKVLMYADAGRSVALAEEVFRSSSILAEARLRKVAWTCCYDALWGAQHVRTRLEISNRLRRLAIEQADAGALLHTASMQVQNYLALGDIEGLACAASEMEGLAAQLREPYYRWHVTVVRSLQAFVAGDLREAERNALVAYEQARMRDPEGARLVYCAQLIGPLSLQGRFLELCTYAQEMHQRYPLLPAWHALLASLEFAVGKRRAARKRLSDIMERGLDWLSRSPAGPSNLVAVAQLCVMLGDGRSARSLYAALRPFAECHASLPLGVASYGPIARQLGMLAACCGDDSVAQAHFERALAEAQRLDSPTHIALCCVGFGELLQRAESAPSRQRGAKLLRRALRLADSYQLHAVRTQVQRSLALHAASELLVSER